MAPAPNDLPDDIASLKALILAARAETARVEAERQRLDREHAALTGEVARLTAQNARLDHIVAVLRRARFGRSCERIDDDQMQLGLEDVETAFGAEDAAAEAANTIVRDKGVTDRRANRGALPKHLPREEIVVEPESTACPCCGDALHVIGEDVSERLDKVPAKLRVIVTRRPKYACRACEKTAADTTAGVIQAPAPARLVTGGLPTEALVADVIVAKYADHLPLYRQSQMLAREGIRIDRSTLAHWVGFAAFELAPLHERLTAILKASTKLFADETRCPVLDPGRGKTKTGYLWAIARDDRPWGGSDPPGVAYLYAPGRGAEHAVCHLAGFSGVLQVDGKRASYPTCQSRSGGGVVPSHGRSF
ncbi:MAG: IS66 family transposase [Hyphomicrobiales bacterium]|nr:IS66 family transposase [Hyphomicrobiales bacterium]